MKSFEPQHEMSRHIKCAYDNDIPFSCTVCLKSFEYSNSWNQQKHFITRKNDLNVKFVAKFLY